MKVGRFTMEVSHADKIFFPEAKLTKGDLVEYYRRIAPTMLPHMRGRPVSMERYPDGVEGERFFQKKIPDFFPSWIGQATITLKEGGRERQVVCEKAADLVYLADEGCITPHIWLSRVDKLDWPDRMILDLDPPDHDFAPVRSAAQWAREALQELGLKPFLMLTGGRGVHVSCPLDRTSDFDAVREFAQGVASVLAKQHPNELTTEQHKNKRRGRLFLDTARNGYGQTAVAPYAVRARPNAPVAAPADWNELPRLYAGAYTMTNIFKRLATRKDPWRDIARSASSLERPRERLKKIRSS